jgi:hypothetical protein
VLLIQVASGEICKVDEEGMNHSSRKVSSENYLVYGIGKMRHVLEPMKEIKNSAIDKVESKSVNRW